MTLGNIHWHNWRIARTGELAGFFAELKACRRCDTYKLYIQTDTAGWITKKYKNFESIPQFVKDILK